MKGNGVEHWREETMNWQNTVACLALLPALFCSLKRLRSIGKHSHSEHTGSLFPDVLASATYQLSPSLRILCTLTEHYVCIQWPLRHDGIDKQRKALGISVCIFCCGEILPYPHVSGFIVYDTVAINKIAAGLWVEVEPAKVCRVPSPSMPPLLCSTILVGLPATHISDFSCSN